MALKTTQRELKRGFHEEIAELKMAIWLKCGDCMGFFLDPYQSCTSKNCPLRKFYPTEGKARSPKFKEKLIELAKGYDNPPNIISSIKSSAS